MKYYLCIYFHNDSYNISIIISNYFKINKEIYAITVTKEDINLYYSFFKENFPLLHFFVAFGNNAAIEILSFQVNHIIKFFSNHNFNYMFYTIPLKGLFKISHIKIKQDLIEINDDFSTSIPILDSSAWVC